MEKRLWVLLLGFAEVVTVLGGTLTRWMGWVVSS